MLGLPFATDGARIAVLLVRLGALPYGHADGRLSVPGAGLVSAVTHYGDPSTVLAPGRSWRSTCARERSCSPETTSGRGSRSASWRSPPCWAKPSGRAVVWFEASCRCTRSPSPRSSVGCGPAGRRPRGNQREGRLGTTASSTGVPLLFLSRRGARTRAPDARVAALLRFRGLDRGRHDQWRQLTARSSRRSSVIS